MTYRSRFVEPWRRAIITDPHGRRTGVRAWSATDLVNNECGCCGGDIGPSPTFPWHYDEEDCRAIREPVTLEVR